MTWDEFVTYDPERVPERKPSYEQLIIELAERHGIPTFPVSLRHRPRRIHWYNR